MEFLLTHPDTGLKTITILKPDGVPYEADSNHPWWEEIVTGAFNDDERIFDLFSIFKQDCIQDHRCISAYENKRCGLGKGHEGLHTSFGEGEASWPDRLCDEDQRAQAVLDDLEDRAISSTPLRATAELYDIMDATTVGIVPCGNPSCDSCYPESSDSEAPGIPDKVISDNLNSVKERTIAAMCEELRETDKDFDHQYDRAEFLEAAVRNYAPHAWPEISRALEQL